MLHRRRRRTAIARDAVEDGGPVEITRVASIIVLCRLRLTPRQACRRAGPDQMSTLIAKKPAFASRLLTWSARSRVRTSRQRLNRTGSQQVSAESGRTASAVRPDRTPVSGRGRRRCVSASVATNDEGRAAAHGVIIRPEMKGTPQVTRVRCDGRAKTPSRTASHPRYRPLLHRRCGQSLCAYSRLDTPEAACLR